MAKLAGEFEQADTTKLTGAASRALQDRVALAACAVDSCLALAQDARYYRDRPFLTYRVNPIQDFKTLPDSFPIPGVVAKALRLSACPGEYEPTSFAVSTPVKVNRLRIGVSPLRSGAETIPTSAAMLSQLDQPGAPRKTWPPRMAKKT